MVLLKTVVVAVVDGSVVVVEDNEATAAVFGSGGVDDNEATAVVFGRGAVEDNEATVVVFGSGGVGDNEATVVFGVGIQGSGSAMSSLHFGRVWWSHSLLRGQRVTFGTAMLLHT